jgi:hypothetical protein
MTAPNGAKTTCSFTVNVVDLDPPKVVSLVVFRLLLIPNNQLVPVGFFAKAADKCSGPIATSSIKVQVFSDEAQISDSSTSTPDAKNLNATGRLQLRAERRSDGDGRVYLIVAKATDSSGNVGFCASSVTVPHDGNLKSITSVMKQAEAAETYAASHNGTPPPGYFPVGN